MPPDFFTLITEKDQEGDSVMASRFSGKKFFYPEYLLHAFCMLAAMAAVFVFVPDLHLLFKASLIVICLLVIAGNFLAFRSKEKISLKRARIMAISFCGLSSAIVIIYLLTSFMVLADAYGMEEVLRRYDGALWFYFLLCLAQPVILPIPEALTIAAGSAVFGPLAAFLAGYAGTLSGIAIMFWAARIGGARLITRLVKDNHMKKYQAFVQKNETPVIALLFIIPVLPDEIICAGSGISGVSFGRFFLLAALTKALTSAAIAYSVQLAGLLDMTATQLLYGCTAIGISVFAAAAFLQKAILKKKSH
jgi:uncharacterized membrane protein YdjX (TVP38/TMEM64 family)